MRGVPFVHRRAIEAQVARHGATVHFVVPEMDSGPIILQDSVPVVAGDTDLAQRCALESTRLAQRSIMSRTVLSPV